MIKIIFLVLCAVILYFAIGVLFCLKLDATKDERSFFLLLWPLVIAVSPLLIIFVIIFGFIESFDDVLYRKRDEERR